MTTKWHIDLWGVTSGYRGTMRRVGHVMSREGPRAKLAYLDVWEWVKENSCCVGLMPLCHKWGSCTTNPIYCGGQQAPYYFKDFFLNRLKLSTPMFEPTRWTRAKFLKLMSMNFPWPIDVPFVPCRDYNGLVPCQTNIVSGSNNPRYSWLALTMCAVSDQYHVRLEQPAMFLISSNHVW